jgi:hypothetical protein
MATTNLFWYPVFKDGAFTANDPAVRRYAIAKAMRGIDLGAELGAPIFVLWGGPEGVEAMAAKPAGAALDRYREAIDFLCGYVRDQAYDMRFALEPKPNEPRRTSSCRAVRPRGARRAWLPERPARPARGRAPVGDSMGEEGSGDTTPRWFVGAIGGHEGGRALIPRRLFGGRHVPAKGRRTR